MLCGGGDAHAACFGSAGFPQVLDTDALALLEPVPCLYQDRVRARWWEDATAGRLRGNFPYRKHFLRDEELPAPVFRKLMGSLTT